VNRQVLELARELASRGEPFVFATVVWRRSPSSGKEGGTALIQTDGRIRGWIGGACAEPTVVRESLRALTEGTPRLLFLGPPEELAARGRDGVVTVPIACQSEGALEVYVEPVLPKPHLVVVGRSPGVDTLARLAGALGWETVIVDDGGSASDHSSADRVVTSLDFAAAGITASSFLVVATQGHYDEDALQRALATPAGYVALVASHRRAAAVLGYLRDRGVPEEALARVHAPAGLDLGAVAHEEIAVAILAQMVQLKAAGLRAGLPADAVASRHEEIDPVCGMAVEVATARHRAVHEGRTYYFCSAGCLQRFQDEPVAFVSGTAHAEGHAPHIHE
jgi:xanthine dehydrogenase accessory factor